MLALQGTSRCGEHPYPAQQNDETRAQTQALYNTARWRKLRVRYLSEHPLCASCKAAGRVVPANVVDHVRPHLGDERLFWAESNLQALCDYRSAFNCHGSKTGREAAGRRG